MMDQSSTTRARANFNRNAPRPAASPRKTNRRALILALVLGVVAAVLTVLFLGGRGDASSDQVAEPTLQVVVATREIAAGQEITARMIQLKALPESAVINNASIATEEVIGQVARYPVAIGEQFSSFQLVQPGAVQALSFQIPEGLRAFTIPVSVINTPAALMAPGDFVDLLLSGSPEVLRQTPQLALVQDLPTGEERKYTVTFLQNIQVLAVQRTYVDNGVTYDSSVRGAPDPKGAVSYLTLALTPEQGQLVSLVASNGKITLSLRRFGDDGVMDLEPLSSMLQVVVASQDLVAGQRITEDMVELKVLPETAIGQNAATATSQIIGQTLLYPVAKGEQLSNLRQAALAENQALSFQIPNGLRAFTMAVNPTNTPAALATPGDYIDVIVAFMDDEDVVVRVETLYQNLRILAVQQAYVDNETPYDDTVRGAPPQDGGANNITLALTPEQAQKIWLLQVATNVAVTVTLRPYQEADIESLRPIIADESIR